MFAMRCECVSYNDSVSLCGLMFLVSGPRLTGVGSGRISRRWIRSRFRLSLFSCDQYLERNLLWRWIGFVCTSVPPALQGLL